MKKLSYILLLLFFDILMQTTISSMPGMPESPAASSETETTEDETPTAEAPAATSAMPGTDTASAGMPGASATTTAQAMPGAAPTPASQTAPSQPVVESKSLQWPDTVELEQIKPLTPVENSAIVNIFKNAEKAYDENMTNLTALMKTRDNFHATYHEIDKQIENFYEESSARMGRIKEVFDLKAEQNISLPTTSSSK